MCEQLFEEKFSQEQILRGPLEVLAYDLLVSFFAMREITALLQTIRCLFGILAALSLFLGGQVKAFAEPSTDVVMDPCLTLSASGWADGHIQVTLNCESGIPYVLQSSTDLQHWNAVLTNSDPSIARAFDLATPDAASFYRVTRSPLPLFAYAIATRDGIALNGNGLTADSYNSAEPNFSVNGIYDPAKASTNGNVASIFGPALFGNHSIEGSLFLGPTASFGSSSGQVLGSIQWNFNTCFPDVVPPDFSNWLPAPVLNTNIDGVIYQYAFFDPTNNYTITNSGSAFYVASNANVRLVLVSPNCSLNIRIDGSALHSGTLTAYQISGSATLFQSVVENGNTANCLYYGLPGVTNITLGSATPFVGTIYAPSANLTANGSGLSTGFAGSCIVKAVTVNSHYMFHFDENLLKAGPKR